MTAKNQDAPPFSPHVSEADIKTPTLCFIKDKKQKKPKT